MIAGIANFIIGGKVVKKKNLVILRNAQYIFDAVLGKYQSFIAFGNGSSEPSQEDRILENEVGRSIAVVERYKDKISFKATISGAELNSANAQEFGIFSGPGASLVRDTGSLLARTLFQEEFPDTPIVIYWEISLGV